MVDIDFFIMDGLHGGMWAAGLRGRSTGDLIDRVVGFGFYNFSGLEGEVVNLCGEAVD